MEIVPKTLAHYRVLGKVGAGGLGIVYKAIDQKTGRFVAIKVLHQKYIRDQKFLGIFHRELLIVAGMHHQHIVSYLDSYFEPPNCFIVTEFIDGWSGHEFLRIVQKIPPLVALCIVFDILQGLDHLHLHDTIHSDLSAANYMLDQNGQVYVNDFGLSCRLHVEDYKNYMVGTPGYYSPEHITENPVVPQTDIYCAGLILYEMLCGEKAVPVSRDRNKTLEYMRNIDFKKIKSHDTKMQNSLRIILKKCLQFKVRNRYKSAEDVILAVYSLLKKHNIKYTRPVIYRFLLDSKLVVGAMEQQFPNMSFSQAQKKGA